MKKIYIKILALLTTIGMIVVNALANILPINNITTAEISDSIPTYFVPAGYVFSIWGLIYIALFVYLFFLFRKVEKEDEKIFPWFIVSNIANSAWIFLWHYGYVGVSVIAMLILLVSLIAIYTIVSGEKFNKFKRAPFQLYLGWISVATIANISAYLYTIQWDGFGIPDQIWAVVMIAVATKLAMLAISSKKDYVYPLVIMWAIFGILYKYFNTSDLITGASMVSLVAIFTTIFSNKFKFLSKKDEER